MTRRQKNCLNRLADLCDQYNAEFTYTVDDDGIHISVDGQEVFVGFMSNGSEDLRLAAYV